jgi:hypothetical protein
VGQDLTHESSHRRTLISSFDEEARTFYEELRIYFGDRRPMIRRFGRGSNEGGVGARARLLGNNAMAWRSLDVDKVVGTTEVEPTQGVLREPNTTKGQPREEERPCLA